MTATAALWTSTVSARLMKSTRLVRGGERQALVGGEHDHDPHGHSVLVLFREGGDDAKAVALDSVVSDSGHVAEIDDLALEGLQPSACAGPMAANANAAARVVWRIVMVVSSVSGHIPGFGSNSHSPRKASS